MYSCTTLDKMMLYLLKHKSCTTSSFMTIYNLWSWGSKHDTFCEPWEGKRENYFIDLDKAEVLHVLVQSHSCFDLSPNPWKCVIINTVACPQICFSINIRFLFVTEPTQQQSSAFCCYRSIMSISIIVFASLSWPPSLPWNQMASP